MREAGRDLVAAFGASPAAGALAGLLERAAPWPRGAVAILTYHRVADPASRRDLAPGLISATPARFAEQMAILAERYQPISLLELVDALARRRRLPSRAVHVTFDDAYADAADAWATMRRFEIPATLFVPTSFAGDPLRPFWWDRLWAAWVASTRRDPVPTPIGPLLPGPDAGPSAVRAIRTWLKSLEHDLAMGEVDRLIAELGEPAAAPPAVLGWPALRRLAGEGLTLAPHTRTHPLLDRIPFDDAVAEIAGAHADLAHEIGPTPPVLAYPSGAHGGRAVEAARAAGMTVAMTTTRGGVDIVHADPLRLRRINVGARAATALVRSQLVWGSILARRQARADAHPG